MTVQGSFRGYTVGVRLTGRERRIFKRAEHSGYLVGPHRIGSLDHAFEIHCTNEGRPCLIVRKGRSTASITLDLTTAGRKLDGDMARDIRMILFRASCKAPSPAAKGRIRRRIMTPTYVYARVPLGWEEATVEALLKVVSGPSERRYAQGVSRR